MTESIIRFEDAPDDLRRVVLHNLRQRDKAERQVVRHPDGDKPMDIPFRFIAGVHRLLEGTFYGARYWSPVVRRRVECRHRIRPNRAAEEYPADWNDMRSAVAKSMRDEGLYGPYEWWWHSPIWSRWPTCRSSSWEIEPGGACPYSPDALHHLSTRKICRYCYLHMSNLNTTDSHCCLSPGVNDHDLANVMASSAPVARPLPTNESAYVDALLASGATPKVRYRARPCNWDVYECYGWHYLPAVRPWIDGALNGAAR